MAARTVLRIQELCDEIADYIFISPCSRETLETATLVGSQALRTAAQSRLFHHLVLDPWQDTGGFEDDPKTRGEGVLYVHQRAAAIPRYIAVIAAAPHLARHVRALSVLALPVILRAVVDTSFPLLRILSLDFIDLKPGHDVLALLRLAGECIALPSLRDLALKNIVDRLTFSEFKRLFGGCSAPLRSIALTNIKLRDSPPDAPPSPSSAPRVQLKMLHLTKTSPALIPWLLSPASPFDLAHLTYLEISRVVPALSALFARASLTLTRLVWRVSVPFDTEPEETRSEGDAMFAADAMISAADLPALRAVEVRMCDLAQARQCMPWLAARGLLVCDSEYIDS
ncbi:hypothetical protein B0H15DRAFT_796120 [Mycena belliarum]|uniref:Uncharacterized protein n=1 Tax=Mycena belliarum TaxID=1033014 RepID=A0AAD6UF02_9AGAR|nr:hypothetical protein B0H15DRAFT_796120 [Mycena belliae]